MYRVNVTTKGKYNNVVLGSRYCFRKKTVIELINLFISNECNFELSKFIYIGHDVFCWSSDGCEKILEKIYCEE